MRMSVRRIAVGATLLTALCNVQASGYIGDGSIVSMQSAYNGWLIKTNGTESNPDGCSTGSYTLLLPTHPQYKELTALLLVAYSNNRPLNIHVSGCHSAGGYKLLNFIYSKGY